MAKITIDANRVTECGDDIIKLANKYQAIINDLFSKLESVNKSAWSGASANQFIAKVKADRKIYTTFGNDMANFGRILHSTGVNVNNLVNKWKD